ncbi:hypothetical protein BH780_gp200 [Bacillus phage Eldridge]|uniref:Uncharacterized protein n=1 Tax=Bacillus phage Eldridge TaxID=1776293 RepID=A0A0Y0AHT9_9CAUD|nr:hypothetical protein BH780_gp200 [Bacillus phage Eldridge]AMB18783.1 hypothetical protein Eldridge_0203 [Bacillus phage Eldridge]
MSTSHELIEEIKDIVTSSETKEQVALEIIAALDNSYMLIHIRDADDWFFKECYKKDVLSKGGFGEDLAKTLHSEDK